MAVITQHEIPDAKHTMLSICPVANISPFLPLPVSCDKDLSVPLFIFRTMAEPIVSLSSKLKSSACYS